MKFIPIFLLAVLIVNDNFAQDYLSPLSNNEILEAAAERQPDGFSALSTFARNTECTDIDQSIVSDAMPIYTESGETQTFCISTTSFPTIDSLICYNCNDLVSGTATVMSANTYCLTYISNTGITLDTSDTLQVGICDDDMECDTLYFPMIIRRANNSTLLPAVLMNTESTMDLCVPDLDLPGEDFTFNFLSCQESTIGEVSNADSCFIYLSTRFAGRDTICVEVCDEFCICDEYMFPVEVMGDTLSLPFFDDFSYAGPYPEANSWLDDNVFVNNSLAYLPPSVGVATFDGLNKRGKPYGGGQGPSDYLTSNYLDLSGLTASDKVYLSFYAAPKGLGFSPAPADSLNLQFKNQNGDWETVWQMNVPFSYSLIQKIPFDTITSIEIPNLNYGYKGFQFRFLNYSNNTGLNDIWHIDYVRVVKNQDPTTSSFSDITFTANPTNILKNYSQMPWRQFKGFQNDEIRSTYDVGLRSFFAFQNPVENSSYAIEEINSGLSISSGSTLLDAVNIPGDTISDFTEYLPSFDLQNAFSAEEESLSLAIKYNIEIGIENPAAYPATERNNTVETIVDFENYLAHDDGTAELAIKLEDSGQAIAIEYDLNVADNLQGFAVMFPRLGQSSGLDFRVLLYKDVLGGNPIFTSGIYQTLFADNFSSVIQGFITYKLRDEEGEPVAFQLTAGKYFFVIEHQENNNRTLIGLDQNNPEFSEKQYFLLNDTWTGLGIDGTYLTRLILGEEAPISTPTRDIEQALAFEIFPNPADDKLSWNLPDEDLEFAIFDLYGRNLWQGKNSGSVNVSAFANGTYYLQLIDPKNGLSGVRIFQILH